MKKAYLISLLLCLFMVGCGSDKEETPTVNTPNEWSIIAENPDRYKEIMSMIGQNFKTFIFEEEDYPGLSEEELATVKDLYDYYSENQELPESFLTAFTEFCVGPNFHDFIIIAEDNPFYAALDNSFEIGWRSKDDTYHLDIREDKEVVQKYQYGEYGLITEENPYIMTFDDCTYDVGNCTFTLTEIQMINHLFKTGSFSNDLRLFLTVTNNSNIETIFAVSNTQAGGLCGQYYQSDGDLKNISISYNNLLNWEIDEYNPIYDNMDDFQTIPANTTKEICVQLGYITTDKLQFTDNPQFDFYFTNETEVFTLGINK